MKNTEVTKAVLELPEVANVNGLGAKLLQIVRSTPFITAALVGHKENLHVNDNLQLSKIAPLSEYGFSNVASALKAVLNKDKLVS